MRVPTARQLFLSGNAIDAAGRDERERAFFHAIRTRNGTNKTTHDRRLDAVNAVVETVLPDDRPLAIMDVAVSSGIATMEWMESLDRAGVHYRMTAGDFCVHASLVSFARWLHVLIDGTGYPLQFDIAGRAVPYPIGRRRALLMPPLLLFAHLVRRMGPRILPASGAARTGRDVLLVSPRLAARADLTIVEDDILVPGRFERAFHVVRAANILSRIYFAEPTLLAMGRNLVARLKPGGILVVCRTDEHGFNHGTIFRLGEDRVEVLRRIGGGSECEGMLATLTP